jgi:hypothetical protein
LENTVTIDNADVTAPVESGQAEVTEVGQATESAPSYEYINTDEFADKYVKLKVDGEELEVPLKEALSGYQRQADYTRKTQELAAQRQSLQYVETLAQALERDPQTTLELLGRHYSVNTPVNQPPSVPEFSDPLERQVWELNQKIASFEQNQAQAELQREISRLQTQYPDFNAAEVIQTALNMGVDNLEAVYKQIAYDRLIGEVNAFRSAQQKLSAETNQVIDAKRQAAFVEGGTSANGAGVEPVGRISSVADAWLAAKRQMGM